MLVTTNKKHLPTVFVKPWINPTIIALLIIVISACSENSGNGGSAGPGTSNPPLGSESAQQFAFVAGTVPGSNNRRIDRFTIDDDTIRFDDSYPETTFDIAIDTDQKLLYQLGQEGANHLTQYDPQDSSGVGYQLSVSADSEAEAIPQDIVFIDDTKAYLTRRGSDDIWIINPTPDINEDFRLGTIDLDAYDTDLPDMTDAIIVDDKLFVLMERLLVTPAGEGIPDKSGFVAVFDTRTDTEIDTNQSPSDLKGIELLVRNPTALQYNSITGEIYVVGRGNFLENSLITSDFYNGGVEVIDPTTYQHSLLIDDGTESENEGYFIDLQIINAQLGYLLSYAGPSALTLRALNPTTGRLTTSIFSQLQNVDITTMVVGPDNHLWVGINDSDVPGIYRVDLLTGELKAEKITTGVIPLDIEFILVSSDS